MKARFVLGLLAVLWLLPGTTAFADQPVTSGDGGRIFVDEDVSLKPGEVFDGDLGVLNGDLNLPEGSSVRGDVFLTNGKASIAGTVDGNLAVIGGELSMEKSGWVRGNVFATGGQHQVAGRVEGDTSVLFGDLNLTGTALLEGDLLVSPGKLERDPGAQVKGNVVTQVITWPRSSRSTGREEISPETPDVPLVPAPPLADSLGSELGRYAIRVLALAFASLVFIAVCGLVALVWPRATRRVSDCISALPAQSLGLGLLTWLLAAGLEVGAVVAMIVIVTLGAMLMATVILIPVGLIAILLSWLLLLPVPLALTGGAVLGWVAVSELVGHKVLELLRVRDPAPLGAAVIGLVITVSIVALLWLLKPLCCAWPLVILLTSLGLGAVFHTRFGSQGCRGSAHRVEPEVLSPGAMELESGQADGPAGTTP